MGRKSIRENKTIYQVFREEKKLTREKASEEMPGISQSHLEKIEYEQLNPTPYDIIMMADCYSRPELCNYYCTHECAIGKKYVPELKNEELGNVILQTITNLNDIAPNINRLIQLAADGRITDDEIKDFAKISKTLDKISLAVSELNLWIDKMAGEDKFNKILFEQEKNEN